VCVNAGADPDNDRQDRSEERDEQPGAVLVGLDGRVHGIQSRRSKPATGGFASFAAGGGLRRLAAKETLGRGAGTLVEVPEFVPELVPGPRAGAGCAPLVIVCVARSGPVPAMLPVGEAAAGQRKKERAGACRALFALVCASSMLPFARCLLSAALVEHARASGRQRA